MPTRKVTERERLTIYARTATDEELEEALEILRVEQRARAIAAKPKTTSANKKKGEKATDTSKVPPGPPNPPKPANDNPQG